MQGAILTAVYPSTDCTHMGNHAAYRGSAAACIDDPDFLCNTGDSHTRSPPGGGPSSGQSSQHGGSAQVKLTIWVMTNNLGTGGQIRPCGHLAFKPRISQRQWVDRSIHHFHMVEEPVCHQAWKDGKALFALFEALAAVCPLQFYQCSCQPQLTSMLPFRLGMFL